MMLTQSFINLWSDILIFTVLFWFYPFKQDFFVTMCPTFEPNVTFLLIYLKRIILFAILSYVLDNFMKILHHYIIWLKDNVYTSNSMCLPDNLWNPLGKRGQNLSFGYKTIDDLHKTTCLLLEVDKQDFWGLLSCQCKHRETRWHQSNFCWLEQSNCYSCYPAIHCLFRIRYRQECQY